MVDTDFEYVLINYKKHINIAAKENKRKSKILKVLSEIDKPLLNPKVNIYTQI